MKRICLYTKDVQQLTGKSERTARRLLQEVKEHLGKEANQFITVGDFCSYFGMKAEEVEKVMTA